MEGLDDSVDEAGRREPRATELVLITATAFALGGFIVWYQYSGLANLLGDRIAAASALETANGAFVVGILSTMIMMIAWLYGNNRTRPFPTPSLALALRPRYEFPAPATGARPLLVVSKDSYPIVMTPSKDSYPIVMVAAPELKKQSQVFIPPSYLLPT